VVRFRNNSRVVELSYGNRLRFSKR